MASYTQFSDNDTISSIDRVFSSAWSGNTNDLLINHFSSSAQYKTSAATASGAFYMEVYNKNPDSDGTAEVQYSIAYGSLTGKGGLDFNDDSGASGISSTKAIYSQYKTLVFGGDENSKFNFNGHTPDDIFIININRARYKNALRLGNVNITLTGSGEAGSQAILQLTDDSVTTSGSAAAIRAGVGREFNLVSGSNGIRLGANNTYVTNSGSYGFIYPDAGFIILNPDALDHSIKLGLNTGEDEEGRNPEKLINRFKSGSNFIIDSQEDIASKYYWIRVMNKDFNYTTNNSFTSKDGTLSFDSMIDNPQTYITTVGLYNNNQDLLAVAKLSQPLPKNFTKESLIKVKLDY